MKKSAVLNVNGQEYIFSFNNRSLAMMERSIGRSILSILSGTQAAIIRDMTIDVTAAGIKYGLQEIGNRDPYDVMDEICSAGGTVDQINASIIEGWIKTGLFLKWAEPEKTETKPTEKK